MADPLYAIPRANSPFSNGDGCPTTGWYNYLRGLNVAATGTNADLLNDITIISDKLGSPDGTPQNIPPTTGISRILGIASIAANRTTIVSLSLVGDVALPGNTFYYGTGPSGAKGFFTIASAFLGAAGDITLTVGTDGVTTIDLADVTPGTAGRLYGLSFDSKGRLANQHALTVTGTPNQVIVAGGDGSGTSIALSTPQDIATTSLPTFAQVTVAADPTNALQLATKQYVDALAQGLDPKQSCRFGTTVNDTLSGLAARDGVTPIAGNRALVKNQTTAAQNGIYLASSGAWTRATDMDAWTEVPGAFTFIEEGTTLADSGWVCTSNQGGTIGTTPIIWVQFAGAGTVTAGTGITVTGNQVSITNTTVTAGTAGDSTHFPIITFNAQGQATGYTTQSLPASTSSPSLRNLLINATGSINQRGYVSGSATTSANQYTVDRWKVQTSGQNLSWTTSAGISTFTAPSGGVAQVVEAPSVMGGTYTLSWIGTATASVNGTPVANGSQITLTGNSTATVVFSGGTFSFPQLEIGSLSTSFDFRPVDIELNLCMRYFENILGSYLTGLSGSTMITFVSSFQVSKRGVVTLTLRQTSVSAASFNLNVGGTWVSGSGLTLGAPSSDARGMSFNLNGFTGLSSGLFSFFNMVGTVILTASSEL